MEEDFTKLAADEEAEQAEREKQRKAAEAVPNDLGEIAGGQQVTREDATAKKPDKKK